MAHNITDATFEAETNEGLVLVDFWNFGVGWIRCLLFLGTFIGKMPNLMAIEARDACNIGGVLLWLAILRCFGRLQVVRVVYCRCFS